MRRYAQFAWAALAWLALLSLPAEAQIKLFKVKKNITFKGVDVPDDPATQKSKAIFGQNKAVDNLGGKGKDEKVLPRTEESFAASDTGTSYGPVSKEAKTASGRAVAKTTIEVGQATQKSNGEVDASIEIELQWPCKNQIDPGGSATARGKVEIHNGTAHYNDITVNGIQIEGHQKVQSVTNILSHFGIVLDPVTVRLEGQSLGEVIEEEVFRADLMFDGGGFGRWNEAGRLELTVPESGFTYSEYATETLVPWATDLTGNARLEEGIFSASGIFMPPSGVITDYWDLVYSASIPTYVIQATLIAGAVDMSMTALPPVTTQDTFDVYLAHDLEMHIADGGQHISEIRISQPGTDLDEYVELASLPYDAYDRLTYLVIGDGVAGSGEIEEAIDLSGLRADANGFLLIAESSFSLPGHPDLITHLNFENNDNVTHLLVRDFSGQIGDDLDLDDDCTLDLQPWSALLDSVSLILEPNPPVQTECHYGALVVGPEQGVFVPGHAFRCTDESWQIGDFDPVSGEDTPGAPNTTLQLNGVPALGNLVSFTGCTPWQPGNRLQVLLSCTGTSGIPLPASGGKLLPLTFDACTSLSLNLAPLFTGFAGADGFAHTPPIPFPPVPPGQTLWAAGFTIASPAQFVTVVGPASFTTQ